MKDLHLPSGTPPHLLEHFYWAHKSKEGLPLQPPFKGGEVYSFQSHKAQSESVILWVQVLTLTNTKDKQWDA